MTRPWLYMDVRLNVTPSAQIVRPPMRAPRFAVLCALLFGPLASAQTYVVSTTSAPFVSLSSPTVPVLSPTSGCATVADCGYAVIPIGFGFTFYGQQYQTLTITADGAAYFEPNPGSSTYPTNTSLPSGAQPQGVLAPFWDNLEGSNPFSRLGHALGAGANGKVLTVEWSRWNHWSATATYDLSFQVRLHESGLIEFHYGPSSGAGQALSATVGIEDPTGAQGILAKACGSACALGDLVPNQVLTFGPGPNTVDLIAGSLTVDEVTQSGGLLTITTALELSNFGASSASAIEYSLHLSADTQLDATDLPLSPATQGPLSLPALGRITHGAVSTVTKPSSGAWFILASVDPSQAIAETSETNNLAVTSSPLVAGVDLVAESISANVPAAGPTDAVTTTLKLSNTGLDAAGAFTLKIRLSANTTLEPTDPVVHTQTTSLVGGQSVTLAPTWTLPANTPTGVWWLLLELDSAGAISETSETNNVVFSAVQFATAQPDLVVTHVAMTEATSPFPPADIYYFGEQFRMEVGVVNQSAVPAKSFSVGAVLSESTTLSLLNDKILVETTGLTLGAGASMTVVLQGVIPGSLKSGMALAPGNYSFFAIASTLADPTPVNNSNKAAPQLIHNPAPDLVPTSVYLPAQVAGGELFPVNRVLRNLGNLSAPPCAYRFYLSKNDQVTPQDVLLQIERADGSFADEGSVTLAVGASHSKTEWVRIPDGIVPGAYYVGVLLDPNNAVFETDELNNGAGPHPVTVVAPRFTLDTEELPDVLVGLPYSVTLASSGNVGAVTWTLTSAAETMPQELTFDGQGRIFGTALQPGIYPITVDAVDERGSHAVAAYVLRVIPPSGTVSITASRLPAPVEGQTYRAHLSAQGGAAPYRWTLIDGALPEGLALQEDGEVRGLPLGMPGATSAFTLRVIDAVGNADEERYQLTVAAPGGLRLETVAHPQAQAGVEFALDITAKTSGDGGIAGPLAWSVVSGRPPAGLSFEVGGPASWVLRGTPLESGAFPMKLGATDSQGREADVELILSVHRQWAKVTTDLPQYVLRGSEVLAAFSFEGGPGTFRIESGFLPPGLSLHPDGTVKGQVTAQAPNAISTFTVSGRAQSGAEGFTTASIEVVDVIPTVPASGCGATGLNSGPLVLLAIAFAFALASRTRTNA